MKTLNNNIKEELRPVRCPFCDNIPEPVKADKRLWLIKCSKKGHHNVIVYGKSRDAVIRKWNNEP